MSKKITVISVDSAVPIPVGDRNRYPWDIMEVGDSFVAPLELRNSLQSRISKMNKSGPNGYLIRKIDDKTLRIWRTK